MKKNYLFALLTTVSALAVVSCSNQGLEDMTVSTDATLTDVHRVENVNSDGFAVKNGEESLDATAYDINSTDYWNDPACAVDAAKLVALAGPENARGLNSVEITSQQMQTIKTFVDENIVAGVETEYDKMMAILKWVNTNINYDWADNEAYTVFSNRVGVCQGYANLMNVMLHTQDIPAVNANGYMANVGGHAWCYVYADSTWYVADPTNTGSKVWKMDDVSTYKNTLQPWTIDMPLYDDGNFVYDWRDKLFQVRQIKTTDQAVVSIPYGAMGYKLTGFDPIGGISDDVTDIYISLNIVSIGDYVDGLTEYGSNLENIYIWNEKNHKLNSYDGCVYTVSYDATTKENTYLELKYVPGFKFSINVAPMATVGKNVICNQQNLEEIHFDASTKTFEDWAVENCPNVERIYVPKGSTYGENAFVGCSDKLQIIEYDPLDTGIRDIRL